MNTVQGPKLIDWAMTQFASEKNLRWWEGAGGGLKLYR